MYFYTIFEGIFMESFINQLVYFPQNVCGILSIIKTLFQNVYFETINSSSGCILYKHNKIIDCKKSNVIFRMLQTL